MGNTKVWLLITLCASVSAFAVDQWFDCRRDDPTCSGQGTCSEATGDCTCSDLTTIGYNCKGMSISVTDCFLNCDGFYGCYDFGSSAECYCHSDRTGAQCDGLRGSVVCDNTMMTIKLQPITPATKLFVPGYENVPACKLDFSPNSNTNFELAVSLTTGCGANVVGTTVIPDMPVAGDKTYKQWFYLRYVSGVDSYLNSLYEATCVFGPNTEHSVTGQITQTTVDHMTSSSQGIVPLEGRFDGIRLRVTADLGAGYVDIASPVAVGDNIRLELGLTTTDVAKDLMYVSCDIQEMPIIAPGYSINIVQDGCAVRSGSAAFTVRSDISKQLSDGAYILDLSAVKFNGFDSVYFICKAKICLADCSLPECVTVPVPSVRRKRAAISQEPDLQETIVARIQVVDRHTKEILTNVTRVSPGSTDTEDCGLSIPLMSGLIVSGSGVLLLSLVSIYLVVKYLKLKKTASKKAEQGNRY